jgi:hypothetical protein
MALRTIKTFPETCPMTFERAQCQKPTSSDLLDVQEDAERFASRVLNGGSKDSMVFGLDAPWDPGKSFSSTFAKK